MYGIKITKSAFNEIFSSRIDNDYVLFESCNSFVNFLIAYSFVNPMDGKTLHTISFTNQYIKSYYVPFLFNNKIYYAAYFVHHYHCDSPLIDFRFFSDFSDNEINIINSGNVLRFDFIITREMGLDNHMYHLGSMHINDLFKDIKPVSFIFDQSNRFGSRYLNMKLGIEFFIYWDDEDTKPISTYLTYAMYSSYMYYIMNSLVEDFSLEYVKEFKK